MNTLLQIIPPELLPPELKAFRPDQRQPAWSVYKMLYEPTHWNEFDWEEMADFAIWRENGTLVCISKRTFAQYEQRNVYVLLGGGDFPLNCAIYGATDAAIAESFTFFCSLKDSAGETEITLLVGAHVCYKNEYHFDFNALHPAQLAQILDANPKRHYELHTGLWNAEQAVILATRPYPLHLVMSMPILAWIGVFPLPCFSFGHLKEFAFIDEGTACVDALKKRQSSFGSLRMDRGSRRMPLSNSNLKRLFELPVFESLKTDYVDKDCALLPFSMKVKALEYRLKAEYV